MFCKNCGKQIPDDKNFCPECGTPVGNNAPQAAPQAAPQNNVSQSAAQAGEALKNMGSALGGLAGSVAKSEQVGKAKEFVKKNLKWVLIGVAGVVAIIVVLCLIFGGKGSSPESIVKTWFNAQLKGDVKTYKDCYLVDFEDYIEYVAEEADMDAEEYLDKYFDVDSFDEYYEKMEEEAQEEIDDRKDNDIEKSFKEIYKVVDIDDDDFDDLIDEIEKNYGEIIDVDDISKAKKVTYKYIVEEDDDKDVEKGTVTVVKYNGDWCIYN